MFTNNYREVVSEGTNSIAVSGLTCEGPWWSQAGNF